MKNHNNKFAYLFIFLLITCCSNSNILSINDTEVSSKVCNSQENDSTILPGIYDLENYLPLVKDKKIAIIGNQASVINNVHLADTLLTLNQNIVKVFCPEHGFRGIADAGQTVSNSTDDKTGLPIVSLYGKNKKPSKQQLADVEVIIFDLQDVGVRFYTYISTLHYAMEACAENNIPLIVLDRPNPNSQYIDGPILDTASCRSFIGMHPVPIVYGMSIGEYAMMINGENWLPNNLKCDINVILCKNYNHNKEYSLPIKPSPNLPNDRSIKLYPSLCLFEATILSVGRGTDKQFQILGHPLYKGLASADYKFTPTANLGASNPVLKGEECYGFDLSKDYSIFDWKENELNIGVLIKAFELFSKKDKFFKKSNSIELLSGNKEFRNQILQNISEETIKDGWKEGLDNFKIIRSKYLLYE